MNRIESAIVETLGCYPDLEEEHLITLFTDYVEESLPDVARGISLPSLSFLAKKTELMLTRIPQRYRKKKELEESEKKNLITSLLTIQGAYDETCDGRTVAHLHGESFDGWGANDTYRLPYPERIASSSILVPIPQLSDSKELREIPSIKNLDRNIAEPPSERESKIELLPPEDKSMPEMHEIGLDLSDIYDKANNLSNGKVIAIDRVMDPLYGEIVELEVGLGARESLELWLNLLSVMEHGDILTVKWTGAMDIPEDELVHYIVEIMLKSGVGPKALPGFDVVEAVREGRE